MTSSPIRRFSYWMLSSHLFSPSCRESSSAFTPMTLTGVFSSWPASEMKRRCRASFSSKGLTKALLRGKLISRINSSETPAPTSMSKINVRMLLSANLLSMNATRV